MAKVAVTGKAERDQLRQMPLTARAEAAVAKARACATVAGMRALSLCGPLGDSEPEPWLHPLTEDRQRLRKMPLMARAEAAVAKARACAAVDAMRTLSLDSPLGSSELEPRLQPRSEDRQHLAQLEPARGDETAEALLGSPTGGRLGRQGAKAYSGHRPAGSLCGVDSHASEQAGSSKRRPQEKQLQLQLAALTRQQSSRLPPQELQRRQHRCLRKRARCLR